MPIRNKSLAELFAEGAATKAQADALLNNLYDGVEHLKDEIGVEYGPLYKEPDTVQLEALFRHIILGHNVTITTRGNPLEYIATVVHEDPMTPPQEFPISELLKESDLNHATLSAEDMNAYEIYVRDVSSIKPKKPVGITIGYPDSWLPKYASPAGYPGDYPNRQFFKDRENVDTLKAAADFTAAANAAAAVAQAAANADIDNPSLAAAAAAANAEAAAATLAETAAVAAVANESYADVEGSITYAEKLSINIYTSSFYRPMNDLLRGVVSPISYTNTQQTIKDALVHSIMAGSGLNKVKDEPIPGTIRGEGIFSKEVHEKRILIATAGKGKAVTVEQGFISSSVGGAAFGGDTKILFTGLIGKYVKAFSVYPHEREYLIPPTKVAWKMYKLEGLVSYFHALVVRTPTKVLEYKALQEKIAKDAAEAAAIAAAPVADIAVAEPEAQAILKAANDTLYLVRNIEALYNKEGWRIRKDPKRNEQITTLVLEANMLIGDESLSPAEKLQRIKVKLNIVRNEILLENSGKNKFQLFFSQESRLKKVIEKIDKLDPEILEKNKKIQPK